MKFLIIGGKTAERTAIKNNLNCIDGFEPELQFAGLPMEGLFKMRSGQPDIVLVEIGPGATLAPGALQQEACLLPQGRGLDIGGAIQLQVGAQVKELRVVRLPGGEGGLETEPAGGASSRPPDSTADPFLCEHVRDISCFRSARAASFF